MFQRAICLVHIPGQVVVNNYLNKVYLEQL